MSFNARRFLVPVGNMAFLNRDVRRQPNTDSLNKRFTEAINKIQMDDITNTDNIMNRIYSGKSYQKLSLLIEASLNGQIDIVKSLIEKFNVAVDNVGDVVYLGSLIKRVTALWCAAGTGNLEVVKILVDNGANVNFLTETKSSPLRAACYTGHLSIVKYLIQHGADVNITNKYNSTCLMIACNNNHRKVAKCLLANGANINSQTNCGATAMHFVVEGENLKLAKLLLSYDPMFLKNESSLTPILVAAEKTNEEMLRFLLAESSITFEEKIEAEELLGASFLNNKDNYNFHQGFNIILNTLKKREKHPKLKKKVIKTVECYNNKVECQTPQELENIKDNVEAVHFEGLIIKERVLGEKNTKLLHSIIYRGATFADDQNFKSCLLLWNHALNIAIYNKIAIDGDLLRFTQMFCEMIKCNAVFELSDIKNILLSAYNELVILKGKLCDKDNQTYTEKLYYSSIMSTLGLIVITSHVLSAKCHKKDPDMVGKLMKIIVKINKYDFRTNKGQTLLHLSLNYNTKVDKLFTTGICCFPNFLAMKLLIYCGADVDAVDIDKNTPLHYIGKFISDFPHIPHGTDELYTKRMAMELLNAGAHTDFLNKFGVCPHTGYLSNLMNLTNHIPRSLKCLSASVLKYKCPKEYYSNELPTNLVKFTNSH